MMFREMRGKLVMMVILALASAGVQSQAPKPYTLRHGDAVMVSVWRDEALRMEVLASRWRV